MKTNKKVVAFVVGMGLVAGSGYASIISTTGVITEVAKSQNFRQLYSETEVFVCQEQSGFVLASDLALNITASGSYINGTSLTPGTVNAGTIVNSYIIHLNHDSSDLLQYIDAGTISFENEILGFITVGTDLLASDPIVGDLPGSLYLANTRRRFMDGENIDAITLSSDKKSLDLDAIAVSSYMDEIRVITIPEPSTLLLTGMLGGGILFIRRRFMN